MNPTQAKNWKAIENYVRVIKEYHIHEFFNDKKRMDSFSFDFNHIYFDFSKHKWNKKILDLFVSLSEEINLKEGIDLLFDGYKINQTEQRPALHTALRQQDNKPVYVDNKNIISEIKQTQQKLKDFSEKVISGKWRGTTGKKITDIVNIGIGGSDLGPKMVVQALQEYRNHLNLHFLSNIDPVQLNNILSKINPETTLFVVVSKSFSTQETLLNAQAIQKEYINLFGKKSISKHFIAVSAQTKKAQEFGIHKQNIFPMWDWVGGRFSMWSPAGISILLAVGFKNFKKLLKGAYQMDRHFKTIDFKKNLPVLAAYLSILYNNFYNFESEATIPYAEKLKLLPAYLQQLFMESNGKSIDKDGQQVSYKTDYIHWGNAGTNAQHSFFQLLHQGTRIIPVSFIAEKSSPDKNKKNHQALLSNMIAQAEALMNGEKNIDPYKNFTGNRPSSTILIEKITPKTLGSLIAYFEHKTFVEGYLWHINGFDQFGVELGKKLAVNILNEIENKKIDRLHDQSTENLIRKIIE